MRPLYAQIEAATRLILASPVYFYGVTAQAKAFIDRCQALWVRKYLLQRAEDQQAGERRAYLLSVAARSGPRAFDGVLLTARYAFDAMGFCHSGDLLVRGVDEKGAVLGKKDSLDEARQLGRIICS